MNNTADAFVNASPSLLEYEPVENDSKNNILKQELAKREALEKQSSELLYSIADIQEFLTFRLVNDDETQNLFALTKVLSDYLENGLNFRSANPRTLRTTDRVRLLPGQHPGINLTFENSDRHILKINVYGALRIFSGQDLRDHDKTLKNLHDKRTDAVLSQPTHINWHITDLTNSRVCEAWIKKTLTTLSLDQMYYMENRVDVISTINSQNREFLELSQSFNRAVDDLTKLIPITE